MVHLKQFICVFITLIVLSFQFSCVKEVDNFPDYPITLTVKDSLGGVRLSWSKIETSDFIEYVIVRSSKDSIPSFSDLSTADGVFVVGRISDAKRTTFFDLNNGNLLLKTYYRVFARLANRNLSSQNYQSNSDVVQISITPSDIVQDEVAPERFYISSSNSGQLVSYDANKEEIIATTQLLSFSSFPRLALYNSGVDDPDLVVWSSGTSRFSVFNGKTLKLKGEVDLTYSISTLATTNDGYVIAYTDDFNNPIKMIRLSDRQIVSQIKNTINIFISSSSIMFRNGNKKELFVHTGSTCSPTVCKITYGNGQLINMTLVGTSSSSGCVNSAILKSSKNGKYIVVNKGLYNDQLAINTPLQLLNNSANDFFFSPSEDKIYSLRQSFNGTSVASLDESTIPSNTINKSFPTKISPFKTFVTNDKIYLFAASFTNQGTSVTLMQKLKL
jgi:hypothetical protein